MQPTQRIRERLSGHHLLVTGSTGFLAKAFVEKLLRSVDTLAGIHLLIRPSKDGLSPLARVERDLLSTRAFDRLRAALGDRFRELCREKIHVVAGDLTQARMGLSEADYEALSQRITVVVNSAATVTFDERLDWAIDLNARGPQRLLQFAKDCGHVPFLHVSTCYVCGVRGGVIVEDFSAPECAREMLPREQRSGKFDLDALETILSERATDIKGRHGAESEACRQELIDAGMQLAHRFGWNDTYTLTKWLGEQLLLRDHGSVPLAVFRPAIIEGSLDEPLPGWIDGLRMADPVIVAYGKGKLGDFPGRQDIPIDLIPVDLVANGMIAALPVGEDHRGAVRLYQSASSDRHPLLLKDLAASLERAFTQMPMSDETGRPVVPPRLRFVPLESFLKAWTRRKKRIERTAAILRKVPGTSRRVRRLTAVARQIEQILYFAKIYAPYTHLDVRFSDDRLRELHQRLHESDRAEFPFVADVIDWDDYLVNRHIPGLRSFVLGGGIDAAPRIRAAVAGPPDAVVAHETLEGHNLFDVFRRSAEKWPAKPALQICRQGRWVRYSYTDALSASGSVMQRFTEHGLRPGDRVVIWSENGPEWGLAYLGAMRAGLTAVPLDPQAPVVEVLSAARFVGAKLICASRERADALGSTASVENESPIPVAILVEPFIPPPGASRDVLPEPAAASAMDLASILFTSGTTLTPRAVPLTHRNIISNAQALVRVQPILPRDEFLSVLPMYHVFEFTAGFVVPIASGSTVTYVEQLKGPDILAAMQATGTTIMLVVPRLLQLFHDSIVRQVAMSNIVKRCVFALLGSLSDASNGRLGRRLFSTVHAKFGGHLRMFVSGGSSLDPQLWQSFRRMGFTVHEGYGMTETAPVLAVTPPGSARPGSVGPPLPNVELTIHNANLEGVGEVWVRGPNVMSGYLNNSEATAEILSDGWLRTGDLGRLDDDGFLHLTGRTKDLIITSAGKNVYPDEVEARYRDLQYVKELCVFGMPAEEGLGDTVHAVVVLDMQAAPELDRSSVEREIRAAVSRISADLPTHQRVQCLHFWTRELPKTTTMKAKRNLIRDLVVQGPQAGTASESAIATVAPTKPVESVQHPAWPAVQLILAKMAKRPMSSIHRDMHLMLDLGIDSLGKIDVVSSIETQFGIRIDDESATRIARAGDLLNVLGERVPAGAGVRNGSAWRRWFGANGHGSGSSARISPTVSPVRWLARGSVGALMHSYVRVHAHGRQNLPVTGAFILAPNHTSHLDAPAVLTAVAGRRRVWVAAAEDYFFTSAMRRFVFGRLFDAIAFDRHSDGVQGLQRCAEALRNGDGLLMFPEGTRSRTGMMQNFKIGTAVLAIQRQVPVVPVRIDNAFALMRKGSRVPKPGAIAVTFGDVLIPPALNENSDPYPVFHDFARRIQEAVAGAGTSPKRGSP